LRQEVDVEIEFQACRCRLPQQAAQAVRARFETNGLRVTSEPSTDSMRDLVVKRVEVITIEIGFDLTMHETEMQVAADVAREAVVERRTIGLMVDGTTFSAGASRRPSPATWLPIFDVRGSSSNGAA
jgi:hypothetical protein